MIIRLRISSIILLLGSAIEFQVGQWRWKVFSMTNFYLSVDFYAVLGDFAPYPADLQM